MQTHALDRRLYRQIDRSGSTTDERSGILLAAEPGDFVVLFYAVSAAATTTWQRTRPLPERAVYKIITIPDNRLTGYWEGALSSKCQLLPLDVGEIERFQWHKIQDLGKLTDLRGEIPFWRHYGLPPPPVRRIGRSNRK